MKTYLKTTHCSIAIILAVAVVVIIASWSIAATPFSRSHPLVLGAGGVLLIVIALHPHIGAYAMIGTFWLSTLFPDAGGFTLNRMLGLTTLAGIILPLITTRTEKIKYTFRKFDYFLFGFVGVILLSVAVNGSYPRTFSYVWDILMGYLLYWLICNTIDNKNKLRTVMWVIIGSNVVLAVSVVSAYITTGPSVGLRRYGGLQQVNKTGVFGAVAIIIILWVLNQQDKPRTRFNVFKYGLVLLFSGAMLLTGNRSGFIALLSSILVVTLFLQEHRTKKRLITVTGLVIISAFVLSILAPATMARALNLPNVLFQSVEIEDLDIQERLYLSQGAWRMFITHPILGIGFGGFGYQLGRYVPQFSWSTTIAHNIYLGTLAEMGILGFLILIALFGRHFSDLWQRIRDHSVLEEDKSNIIYALSVFTGVSVNALFHGAIIDQLFFIVFSLGATVLKVSESENKIMEYDNDS